MKSLSFQLAEPAWIHAKWEKAICRVPALLIILAAGLYLHEPAGGVVAAGTAFSVGLVGERKVAGSSFLAMVGTAAGMAFSAGMGTLSGGYLWLNPVVTAVWGLVFAFLAIYDEDTGWIAMQGIIALVIASAFPSHGIAALGRAAAVGIGGAVQVAILALISFSPRLDALKQPPASPGPARAATLRAGWDGLVSSVKTRTAWHYAARVALTMIIAVEAGRALHIQNGYWLPMTTVIVLKPDFFRTYSGAVQRVVGTFMGVLVASLVAHLFRPSPAWLMVLVAGFSFGSFMLVKVHPILFSAVLTGYVVFLIAFTGLPEAQITWHRLFLTALGCALALLSRALAYRSIVGILRGLQPVGAVPARPS